MSTVVSGLPPRFDALSPEVVADPYPSYRELREAGPLCRMGPASFGVTRYRDVASLIRDPRLGSEFPDSYHRMSAGEGPAGEFFGQIVLYRDPPDHTRLRRLIGKAFSPSLVRAFRPRLERMVDDLLEEAAEGGGFDAVRDLAFPLPVMVVCALMGIPAADHDLIRPHALNLGRAFAAIVPESDRAAADEAVRWLRGYLGEVLATRRAEAGDDLLSRMLAAEDGGDTLSHEEIVDNAVFSFFAGFETTTNLIATGCAALLDHPDQLGLLRADPGLVPRAVEEFLRYDSPIQGVARMVREPLEVGGRTIRAGRVLILLLGSANRDQERFDDPDSLLVTRDPNPHVAFGGGTHLCLGAALARVEADVVFRSLLRRFRVLAPAAPPTRRTGTFRAYESIPVAVEAA
ncbi:cytochrome P450 [Nonomuraea sp. NPDC046802]|uniref:cytochrome P450 n=1 Tax=Nonomuraea sp. NPDC046802 TaxID=3154919 RepID=UPI003407C040